MSKYKLEPSKDMPAWWVLTDTENLIVCRFEQGKFNETQKFSMIEESELANSYDANAIASLLTHMGDWLVRHHSSIAFSNVYCFEYDEEIDDLYLCRNKHPKWRMRIDDYMAKKQFADSLKKAAEWLLKSPDNG